jgi:hypothetical protein
MNENLEVEIVSIDRIDDMLGGFAWAQVSVGMGDPEKGPCSEVVLRVPIQYESGETIANLRARIWREGVRMLHGLARALDAETPPPLRSG